MSTIAAELTTDGNFKLAGDINTRLPVVGTTYISAHFPFDSRSGSFDSVKGNQFLQSTETGVNLIEALAIDWRDPSSWSVPSSLEWNENYQALKITGYHNMWLNTPIVVDTNKHYQVSMEIMEEVQSSSGLYLGGFDTNASGERVTPNYDYSYAAYAQPTTGVWTTYRCTRYGTGNISSNTSTSFSTVVGWTGTRTDITDLLTKYYYYGGLFNYSSGGVMYIRNLSVVVVDDDTSNATITADGITVERATTNFVDEPTDPDSGWGTRTHTTLTTLPSAEGVTPPLSCKGYKLDKTCNASSWSGNAYAYSNIRTHPCTAGSSYTASVWCFVSVDFDGEWVRISSEGAGNGASYYDLTKKGTWQRLINTFIASSTANSNSYLYFSKYGVTTFATLKGCIIYTAPQFEESSYPTSFVDGSRNAGELKLNPSLFPQSSGTIVVTARTNIPSGTTTKIFSNEISSAGNTIRIDGSGSIYFNSGGGTHTTTVSDVRAWNTYAYRINADSTVSCYVNGVNTGNISTAIYSDRTNFQIGKDTDGSSLSSIEIKNFTIYNQALTTARIKELSTNTFELKTTGDLITSGITTKPSTPTDSFYFPLGFDAKDQYKIISPVEDLNSVYENSFVWIGAAVTNAFTNYTTPIFTSAYNGTNYGFGAGADLQQVAINSYKLIPSCAITKVSRITGGTSQRDYVYNAVVSEAGSTKIISFWYYGTYGTIFRPYNNDGSATLYYLKSDGTWSSGSTAISVPVTTNEWQKITLKMVNNGTTGTGLTWMILHYDTATATLDNSQYWMFTGWQVTTSLIEYPFVAGTRSDTSLKFADMKTAPQLPSTKPFTYFITFKVFPGANTTQTPLFSCTEGGGFNLSIDGSGNLRSEVHNGTGYNGTTTSGYDYRDGKVHTATLVVGASDIIMYLDGIEVGRAAGWMTGVDVYYGTANYNLFLGVENNNGTASSTQFLNGYLRDFICIPREVSATEIHDITQIKLDMASGTRIQGNIATSQVLI